MMQRVIFLTTFHERGIFGYLHKVLLPTSCIERFFKAIVKLNKKVITFLNHLESQHFLQRNVGFFLFVNQNSNNQYVRQGFFAELFGRMSSRELYKALHATK